MASTWRVLSAYAECPVQCSTIIRQMPQRHSAAFCRKGHVSMAVAVALTDVGYNALEQPRFPTVEGGDKSAERLEHLLACLRGIRTGACIGESANSRLRRARRGFWLFLSTFPKALLRQTVLPRRSLQNRQRHSGACERRRVKPLLVFGARLFSFSCWWPALLSFRFGFRTRRPKR